MDKQQQLKIALPVLLLIMAFIWGKALFGGGSKTKTGKKSAGVERSAVPPGTGSELMVLARANERKKAHTSYEDWGRNPFMLTAGPKAAVLEGILWDAQNPKAIINGDILGVSDPVGAGEIIEIKPNSVIIRTPTGEKVLKLGQ